MIRHSTGGGEFGPPARVCTESRRCGVQTEDRRSQARRAHHVGSANHDATEGVSHGSRHMEVSKTWKLLTHAPRKLKVHGKPSYGYH